MAKTKCTPGNLNATVLLDEYGEGVGDYYYFGGGGSDGGGSSNSSTNKNNYVYRTNQYSVGSVGSYHDSTANDCTGGNRIGLITFYWFGVRIARACACVHVYVYVLCKSEDS